MTTEKPVTKPEVEEPKPKLSTEGFTTSGGDEPRKRGGGFSMGGFNISSVVPAIAVGILLYVFMSSPQSSLVTKTDYTKNLGLVSTDIAALKTSITQTLSTQDSKITNQLSNQNNEVSSKISSIQSQLDSRASKESVDALSNLRTQVADQLSAGKAENQKIFDSVLADMNKKIADQSTNVTQTTQQLKDKSTSLDTRLSTLESSPKVSGVQLTANVTGGTISLGITADQNQYVAFRVIFKLVSGNITSSANSSDDFIKALYTTPPVALSTNVVLIPQYRYTWQNNQWTLTQVEFLTARTAISQGYQAKTMSYSFSDTTRTYEVLIEPVIDSIVGSGGSNW